MVLSNSILRLGIMLEFLILIFYPSQTQSPKCHLVFYSFFFNQPLTPFRLPSIYFTVSAQEETPRGLHSLIHSPVVGPQTRIYRRDLCTRGASQFCHHPYKILNTFEFYISRRFTRESERMNYVYRNWNDYE